MFAIATQLGYPALFGLVFAESAGVPVPGETALIAAGVLVGAFAGRLAPGVRVVAAVLAGASALPWPRFAIYNLAGTVVWATTAASLAALVGPKVAGLLWVAAFAAAALVALFGRRRRSGAGRVPEPL